PSMAMLMTPDRSPTIPHSAPKMNGTASASAPCSKPVNEMAAPATAHARNDMTNSNPNRMGSHSGCLRALPVSQNAYAAASKQPTASTIDVSFDGTASGSSWIASLRVDKPNVAVALSARMPNTTSANRPSTV